MDRGNRRVGSRVVKRRILILALLVAPLLAGELAIRGLIAIHNLPIAAAHQPSIEIAWTNYERTGPADILILGDSLARMGIHPDTLETLAGGVVGRPVTAYNLSTPGAGFPVYRAFVEELARDGRLPKVAVIGISTVELQRDRRQAGRALRSPFGRLVSDCSEVRGLEQTLSCHLESWSALWRWRGQPRRLVGALAAPVPATGDDSGIILDADGYARGLSMKRDAVDGKVAVALRNTAPMAGTQPDLKGYVDLVEALRSHGVRVAALLMPYAPPFDDALEARDPGWRALRSRNLERLGQRAGQPILESQPIATWWTFEDSSDARHFSPIGSRAFTRHLWRERAFRTVIIEALGPASSGSG